MIFKGANHVIGVKLKDGKFFMRSFSPPVLSRTLNAELARSAMLDCFTGIVGDRHFRTNDPAIVAVGEVAEWQGRCAGTTSATAEEARW